MLLILLTTLNPSEKLIRVGLYSKLALIVYRENAN